MSASIDASSWLVPYASALFPSTCKTTCPDGVLLWGGIRCVSGVGASREIGGRQGYHTGLGAGRREMSTLAASFGPPFQQRRG